MSAPRKPKLTPRRRQRIVLALRAAQQAQTDYWNSLGDLESATGFDFCMDDKDLDHYGGNVEDFIAAAWENRDR